MSNSSSIGTMGLGGSIRYEAIIKNNLSWTCTAGYLSFFDFEDVRFPTSNSMLPISSGVKYYFSETGYGLYAAADLGLNFISYTGLESSSASDHRFCFSPGIGYRTNRWDITGRYNSIHDANYFNLRVAYVFKRK